MTDTDTDTGTLTERVDELEADNERLRRRISRIESALGGISGPLSQFLDPA